MKESLSLGRRQIVSRKAIAARATSAFTLAELQDGPRLTKKAAKRRYQKLHRKPCLNHKFGPFGTASTCTRCGFVQPVDWAARRSPVHLESAALARLKALGI